MFTKGNYVCKTIYYNGKKEWLLYDKTKPKKYHAHVRYERSKAAIMIVIRASKGIIPSNYTDSMVYDVNRLWFGKDFLERKDLVNDDLLTNDPIIRIKYKNKKTNYINKRKCI